MTQLLTNIIWYRSTAAVKRYLLGGVPETPTPQSAPIARLPQELVGAIFSYFIYDTRILLACSMTCYSWYIVASPHLHHSLTTDDLTSSWEDRRFRWPNPLQKSYDLGLLPLVKRFRVRLNSLFSDAVFAPDRLRGRTLRHFSALTNLQELGIDYLQVASFMPDIHRFFGHFAPTLRFLALMNPAGSPRQILYFIGLFPNLQDLKLLYSVPSKGCDSAADADLVPPSVPPLRGRLTLTCLGGERLMKDMITFFGGLRFRSMDLFRVKCVGLLLDACAETLETLRLYPTDPYGEGSLQKESELKPIVDSGQRIRAKTFQPVAEHAPSDT